MIAIKKLITLAVCAVIAANCAAVTAFADNKSEYKTSVKMNVVCEGQYTNWDGVTNAAQFIGDNGEFCFAYDGEDYVTVVRTKNGKPLKKRVILEKKHPLFGTAVCDSNGYYYLVTGEKNTGSNRNAQTIFVSKYDKNGKHIKTVGDDGSSSLEYYYDSSFNTSVPFDGGNCDAAVNGNLLTVNYGRHMYSGHQSNSVFTVETDSMTPVNIPGIYNSHSFAQRVIPYKEGFVYLSEGDAYPRAFSVFYADFSVNGKIYLYGNELFHFWLQSGSGDNMYSVNNNFAHAGGIANIGNKKIAMLGTSVRSLNSNAKSENEQLFIQIFDPAKDCSKASSFSTSGTRSGTGGLSGNEKVTDYGVKWLTNYDSDTVVSEPQIVSTDDGRIVILYEKHTKNKYNGVFYAVLDENGDILKKTQLFSKTAHLNSCEMPVYAKGKIWWVQNNGSGSDIYIYSLELD